MASSKPNIIFIMADDHAAKAISAYKSGINHTPNLDRLANDGMLFNHCYVTNSICTPSRAAVSTGTHNHVNAVMTLDHKINNLIPQVIQSNPNSNSRNNEVLSRRSTDISSKPATKPQ